MAALAATLVVAALLLPLHPAAADEVSDRPTEVGAAATVGFAGHDTPDTWRPVTVTLSPDEPVRGRIVLAATGGSATVMRSLDVEVTAGTTKRWHLLAPPGSALQVQLVEDDGRVAQLPLERRPGDVVLAGVLGSVDPAAVPRTSLPATGQAVEVVAVPDGVLDLGPRALEPLGTIVVREADLDALSDAHRTTLATWTAHGGGLVVAATTRPDLGLPWRAASTVGAATVEPAPGAWGATLAGLAAPTRRPVAAGADVAAVAAGRGRLVVTTGDVGTGALAEAGAWDHLLHPAARAASNGRRDTGELPGIVEQVLADAVGAPPSIGWLAGFFVLYVIVAGPVVGMVMSRRRRPELAWVVLPLVTAVFAVTAFLGATGSRPRAGAAAELGTWVDGVGTTTAVVGLRAPRPGQHTVTLPGGGWDVRSGSWDGRTRVTDGDATQVELSLPGQGFGGVVARRGTDAPAPLDVEVAVFGDEARVEVTNVGAADVHDVTLRLATVEHALQALLPAGETVVRTVPVPAALPRQLDPFARVDGGPFGMQPGRDGLAALLRWDELDRAPGLAWVTGELEAAPSTAPAVDGHAPTDRGALVAVGVTPPVTDDATTPFEVQRDVVAIGPNAFADGPLTLSGSGPATLRFRLPAEGEVAALQLALDRGCCAGFVEPAIPARCGLLEQRDPATGDLVESRDLCSPEPPCPEGAVLCEWGAMDQPTPEGRACFEDGTCRDLTWSTDGVVGDMLPPRPAGGEFEVWDHLARRWVESEVVDVAEGVTPPWLGPLGDVWVRVNGEFGPLDVAPQSVSAVLGGDA